MIKKKIKTYQQSQPGPLFFWLKINKSCWKFIIIPKYLDHKNFPLANAITLTEKVFFHYDQINSCSVNIEKDLHRNLIYLYWQFCNPILCSFCLLSENFSIVETSNVTVTICPLWHRTSFPTPYIGLCRTFLYNMFISLSELQRSPWKLYYLLRCLPLFL